MNKKVIGIKDVAENAGVSTATVSHVINGTRYVSKEIVDKVNKVMTELDYQPNRAARSLRSTKTNTIGFLIPVKRDDTSKSFFMTIAEGIEEELKEKGYNLILSNSKEDIQHELQQLKLFNSKLVDGLILAPTNENYKEIEKVVKSNFPIVMIDRLPQGYNGDHVLADNYTGTYNGIVELIKSNYKRIGFLTSDISISSANERYKAYTQALCDYHIPYQKEMVGFGEASFRSGYKLAEKIINSNADAIFVSNNIMTMGAMSYIQENKLNIPNEIALIGYDDYDWTKMTTPPISVIKQPAFEIGINAAKSVLSKVNNKNAKTSKIYLKTDLIRRQSY